MMRRRFLAGALALGAMPTAAQRFQLAPEIAPLVSEITGGTEPESGGIEMALPQIAENGNSVSMRILVASPMSASDRVAAIHVLAERNPRPLVATFRFGSAAGRAEVSTRVRLAATQDVTVIAELSGRRYRVAARNVIVTAAACLDDSP